jgi:mRNA-degrading endonuclease RelE of RelBE toxin-antitoxin system
MRSFTAGEQAIILHAIQRQLTDQPNVETRNKKPMRPNPVAPWELRVGKFRVFYDILMEPEPTVEFLAVGVKERDQLRIGGRLVKLEDPGIGQGP